MSESADEPASELLAPLTDVVEVLARAFVSAVPVIGGPFEIIYTAIRERHEQKARELLEAVVESAGQERLLARVGADSHFASLFYNAVGVGVRTGMASKRRLLSRAVSQAALDDAKLDESLLIVAALDDIDVPHALALARLADEWAAVQVTPSNASLWGGSDVWDGLPEPVRAVLVRVGAAKPGPGRLVRGALPTRQEGDQRLRAEPGARAPPRGPRRRTGVAAGSAQG